jgi:heat shock protein HslJ
MKQLILALIATLILASCAVDLDPKPPTSEPLGSWTLISGETPDGTIEQATLTIEAESIGGQGPCNVYGGSAEFFEDTVSFSEIFSTLMYCGEDTVMEQETAYFAALSAVDSYRLDGDELALIGEGVLLRYAPLREEPTLYFVPMPCEEQPSWYPSNAQDINRVTDHLTDQGIDAQIVFVDRGAVCRACLETCAGSYLIAQVSADSVDAMLAQGWRSTHPFPDEERSSEPTAPLEFSYYPVQCELVPWDSDEMIIDEDLIAAHYRERGLSVSNVERLELDLVTCDACYVCPSSTGYTLTLEAGDPNVLVRDGWVGGPSCDEIGCSAGRTCSDDVCVLDASAQ